MEAKKIEERRGSGGATADNGEDDEKIEAFFELIRSFREARNRREEELNYSIEHNTNNNNNNNKKKIRLIGDKLDESRQWVPAFQWEDFIVDDVLDQSRKLPASSFPGKIEEKKKKKKHEEIELDLNLSL
ncbi:hypothetical protein ACFE04_019255 [Oxalis oulophora]